MTDWLEADKLKKETKEMRMRMQEEDKREAEVLNQMKMKANQLKVDPEQNRIEKQKQKKLLKRMEQQAQQEEEKAKIAEAKKRRAEEKRKEDEAEKAEREKKKNEQLAGTLAQLPAIVQRTKDTYGPPATGIESWDAAMAPRYRPWIQHWELGKGYVEWLLHQRCQVWLRGRGEKWVYSTDFEERGYYPDPYGMWSGDEAGGLGFFMLGGGELVDTPGSRIYKKWTSAAMGDVMEVPLTRGEEHGELPVQSGLVLRKLSGQRLIQKWEHFNHKTIEVRFGCPEVSRLGLDKKR